MIARLKYGPLDTGMVMVKDSTKWIFFSVQGNTTTDTKMAEWPHDDAPVGRPPLPKDKPIVCYRLLHHNEETGKAEFEYDEKHSDEIEVEYGSPAS